MGALILDTETTGLETPHATEIAYIKSVFRDGLLENDYFECNRYNPLKPITLGSMAITGICDEDVAHCRPHTEFRLPTGTEYIIGHNIDYDCDVLINAGCDMSNIKRICTLALVKKHYPECDSHTLTSMLYYLHYDYARLYARKAHNAGHDIKFNARVLKSILEKLGSITSMEQLYQESESSRIPTVMTFGKYKGTLISEIPDDYINWYLKQAEQDEYLVKAFEMK